MEAPGIQRLAPDEGRISALPIESHNRDLSERIGFNIEVDRPRAKPLVQSPVFVCRQVDAKVARIVFGAFVLRLFQRSVVDGLPVFSKALDRLCREEIIPRRQTIPPPSSFGLASDSGKKAKRGLNHDDPMRDEERERQARVDTHTLKTLGRRRRQHLPIP